ncbi:MAG: ATP-dependent zinc metalloprotease FtsH [Anaerolineales bacterium]
MFPTNKTQNDNEESKPGKPQRRVKVNVRMLIILFLIILVPWVWTLLGDSETDISYSTFVNQVRQGNVAAVTISGEKVTGEMKSPVPLDSRDGKGESETITKFITYIPQIGDDQLMPLLHDHEVEVTVKPESDISWWSILINVLPFLFLIGIGYMIVQRMQGQGQAIFNMRQSGAKRYQRDDQRTTFDDVAGCRSAKRELQEVIAFLKDPGKFERLGGEIPLGVLLVGPPGTGKTLLARAVAGEADVPFFNITGSDFMEMFVGVGASRVRDLFDQAKKAAPSIVFIDELDSIGRRRGAGLGGGHDEREQTLNQLLSELDGFEPNTNVIVMGATNRPDILDPALLRPGRFDRRITVNMPTMKDRKAILEIHSEDKPLAEDVDLEKIARGTPGFSGADLENVLNEAALLAARKDKDEIEREDIEEARDKVLMGLKRESLALTEEECRFLAYHEAGHAVVAAVLPHADPIHKVTIVPRGKAMGVTQQLPEKDRYLYNKEYMLDRLAVMMGGRAAEEMVFDTATSGAENDLKQAKKLVRKMVLDWGMSEKFKNIALGGGGEEQVFLGEEITKRRDYSESTAREVDQEVKAILNEAFNRAQNTLQDHRDGLDKVVKRLLEVEEIPGEEVLDLLGIKDEDEKGDLSDDEE